MLTDVVLRSRLSRSGNDYLSRCCRWHLQYQGNHQGWTAAPVSRANGTLSINAYNNTTYRSLVYSWAVSTRINFYSLARPINNMLFTKGYCDSSMWVFEKQLWYRLQQPWRPSWRFLEGKYRAWSLFCRPSLNYSWWRIKRTERPSRKRNTKTRYHRDYAFQAVCQKRQKKKTKNTVDEKFERKIVIRDNLDPRVQERMGRNRSSDKADSRVRSRRWISSIVIRVVRGWEWRTRACAVSLLGWRILRARKRPIRKLHQMVERVLGQLSGRTWLDKRCPMSSTALRISSMRVASKRSILSASDRRAKIWSCSSCIIEKVFSIILVWSER